MNVKHDVECGGLRELRRAAGLSQQRVAELAGCSIGMIGLLERGYAPASSRVLDRVAAVLNDRSPAGKSGLGGTVLGGGAAERVRPD